jgi:hypothetical protein
VKLRSFCRTSSVDVTGKILTIHQVSTNTDVIQVTLTDTTSGAYTVTQLHAIDHPAGGDENDLAFTVNYLVSDHDGDSATGSPRFLVVVLLRYCSRNA